MIYYQLFIQECAMENCILAATVVFSASSLTAYIALSVLPRKRCGIITFIGAFSGLIIW